MHLLVGACESNISSRDSPEIDVRHTEDRSMLFIRQRGPSHASVGHFAKD